MVRLEPITEHEWATWRPLRLAALAESPAAFGSTLAQWKGEGDTEQRWRDRLGVAGSHNVVAFVDNEPSGMLSGMPDIDDPTLVWLMSMWVAPAARGSSVAQSLVHHVLAWAETEGMSSAHLHVREQNARAIAFYRRCGFTETGRLETEVDDDGVVWTELEMSRQIGQLESMANEGARP